jgi:hypothetical protein
VISCGFRQYTKILGKIIHSSQINLNLLFLGGLSKYRVNINPKSFLPKWTFVKSIPDKVDELGRRAFLKRKQTIGDQVSMILLFLSNIAVWAKIAFCNFCTKRLKHCFLKQSPFLKVCTVT